MRPGLALCALFVPLAAGFAAEEPKAPAAGDSISAAKRDFDTIKAARDSAQQQKGDLPQFSVPEMQTVSPTLRSSKKTKEEEAKMKKKSANWLLDAMEKKPEPKNAKERDAAERTEEMRLLLQGQKEREPGGFVIAPAEPAASIEKDRKAVEPPPNPLNQFLAGWMTPQDYALLKPGLQSSNNPNTLPQPGAMMSAPVPGDLSVRPDLASALAGPDRPAFSPAKSTENPYLQTFNEPAPFALFTPPTPPVVALPPPGPAPNIFTPPAPPPPPLQSKIPDFAKPVIDDKYFKPLKRF